MHMQVEAACHIPWLQEVILDFLEVHGLRKAVAAVKAARKRCVVATPRILKPGEERLAAFYLRLQPHALLLRSAGLLWQLSRMAQLGVCVNISLARKSTCLYSLCGTLWWQPLCNGLRHKAVLVSLL